MGSRSAEGVGFRCCVLEEMALVRLSRLIWRVNKPDEPVLTQAFIVGFGTNRKQLTPWHRQRDPILRNALAYQHLFDPSRASPGKREIVAQVTLGGGITLDVKTITRMILQVLDIGIEDMGVQRIVVDIPGEDDRLYVSVEGFLRGTK
jgi:hypothetical protein